MTTDMKLAFTTAMAANNIDKETIKYLEIYLWQFQQGIIDPHAHPQAVADVQSWAMKFAKRKGAQSPRAALSMVRGYDIDDEEWKGNADYWEFAWPSL